MFELVLFLSVLLGIYVYRRFFTRLPPGPICWYPFVGYLPFLTKDPPRHLDELRRKYGSIFGLYFGSRYVVCLADFQTMKEVFNKDVALERPPEIPFAIYQESMNLMTMNGPFWQEQRRYALQLFKSFAFTEKTLEHHIQLEVSHLLMEIDKHLNTPFEPTILLIPSMSNIISSLTFGKRFEYDDPDRIMLDNLIMEIPRRAGQVTYIHYMPWLKKIALWLKWGSCNKLREALIQREAFCEKRVKEHEETFKDNMFRDYIDYFLHEMKNETKGPSFRRNVLIGNVASFFGAGSETVRTTIDWLLLVCAAHPDIRVKVQAEIDQVIGDRKPTWDDNRSMPYTMAVIWELFRWKPINPINILRKSTEETYVKGYRIPKGSIVISCIWSIHNDKNFWDQPDEYRPERFLKRSESGELKVHKPEHLVPFSYGKRACPGEVIAKMEVFIYFVSILQKFHVYPPPGKKVSFAEVVGVSLRPVSQSILFQRRVTQ
ncbi:cytochrome P450 2J6-like [Varroa jacobsoni]|uniref:Cytochrome P450 n=1 Tax=Varroa destructor TaxID=109461 RepID=A0A7M7M463_VARDE|nr:cytochrome P450 2J6-like isoform X2 [Varroa destructor]XP_022709091.1 cytochrome P450 2J6-like [Varroa jacobsoni]XP_022709092.1 cytochrome P450 2J6-like [Varroa jacobsoni]XP_022709093.1 cytochrome P450 2J6-like [Varroa jacobsoni]XP_022709094.1 cytochrome P450 2J6-like [Varroa jacobsoni]XP_022709095.1 cytochrome P450 2J6-like [Varroa jacobsoni]XP_022709096.1 cytochrome P450 2J6-like [Varroa jacobsoni]